MVSVSRRGKTQYCPNDQNVTYIKGDASDPESFRDALKESDAVIHTIGTLIDSTIAGNKKPGDTGTQFA